MQSNIRGPYGPWQRKARIFHTSGHGRLLPGYVWLVISRTPDEGGSKAHKFPMEELITWGIKGWDSKVALNSRKLLYACKSANPRFGQGHHLYLKERNGPS
ncbi:hypothetical protein CEXT_258511 [Caerostris extrusa]|uniref:Uncharacterized protein n=1 Tax=Caerostris extrusa TaxID=172846 RepID=A0AAV4WGN6_CAEEX|nr:hypothetical protein CEXT_258511 [Caerostris extrusa]